LATARDLQRQINTVKNQARVFSALQTVSSVKFRKAEARVKKARPYADNVEQMMRDVAGSASGDLPLLVGREVSRVAVCTLTADRGLAGGFNAQIIRRSLALMREQRGEGREVVWFSTGRKAASTLRFRRLNVTQSWTGFSERPAYTDAQGVAHAVAEAYTNGDVDTVFIVYNAFVSALTQKVTVRELLPIPTDLLERREEEEREEERFGTPDFIYEPEPEEILARLLPVYVETELYRALLESAASEQGARMTAMRNASKAAGELIDNLTLAMNRARQAEITQEILEVVAGADALSG
jgi:F-type H+-transporting ATPase subunit gamma